METLAQFDSLILADNQSAKLRRATDAIASRNFNEKYLTIEQTLKSENSTVNKSVEEWKSEIMEKVDREMKQQTLNYVDRFHAMSCKTGEETTSTLQNPLDLEDDEVNIVSSLNKTIQLDPALLRSDFIPVKPKSRDEQHVIFLLETKIKQMERELREVKSELRNKNSAYEELMSKLNTSETDRRKTVAETRSLRETNKRLENQIHDLKTKLGAQAADQDKLAKNLAHLNKNNKHIDTTNKNKDILINKLNEEKKSLQAELAKVSRLKQDEQAKKEKELRLMEINLRRLEKQKNELIIGFKKQMEYINVLKQQRVVHTAKAIHDLQKQDYYNMLDNPHKIILDVSLDKATGKNTSDRSSGKKSPASNVYKFQEITKEFL